LPVATETSDQDEVPVSQGGITRSVRVGDLLAQVQQAITTPSNTLLGRASLGPGGPESVQVGAGLAMNGGALAANGADHALFPQQGTLTLSDTLVLNSSGAPRQMPVPLLRGLFAGGSNVSIDASGHISAATDPSVTQTLTSLGQQITATAAKIPTGGFVGLNAQGQITAPMAGDVSSGTVTLSGGVPRGMAARAADVVNVRDFGARTDGSDCSAAFNAAFAALPASGGEVFVPAGDYTLAQAVSWSGKAVTLRGAGKGVSNLHVTHAGTAITVTQASGYTKTTVRDLTLLAENGTQATAAALAIVYPAPGAYQSAYVLNVEFFGYPNDNGLTAPFPFTFQRGVVLRSCGQARVENISWFGPRPPAGGSGAAVIELAHCVDVWIDKPYAIYGHALVLQSDYCEGIRIHHPTVINTDYCFVQGDLSQFTYLDGVSKVVNADGSVARLALLGFYLTSGEVNCQLGTCKASLVGGGYIASTDHTRDGGPDSACTMIDLTDCANFQIIGNNFLGHTLSDGSMPDTAVALKYGNHDCSGNSLVGNHFENFSTAVLLGPNTINNTVVATWSQGGNGGGNNYVDQSDPALGNLLTWQTTGGGGVPAGTASAHDHLLAGRSGQTLFRVGNVDNAANYVQVTPAASGSDAVIGAVGPNGLTLQNSAGDVSVGNRLRPKADVWLASCGTRLAFTDTNGATPYMSCQLDNNLVFYGTDANGANVPVWAYQCGLASSAFVVNQAAVFSNGLTVNLGTTTLHGPLVLTTGNNATFGGQVTITNGLVLQNLPTARPAQAGTVWNNNGVLSIA
ncbi:MAG TPA: glycosyl hydrolase family 28-related protein, partial [Acetobacteraceae bacterium]|nr:glycosyl hydrolase family 28-related protein [Acetobacteraceae bacterium]